MNTLHIGTRREVCWDEALIDTVKNIRIQMHTPEYRGEVMKWDAPWEGSGAGCLTHGPKDKTQIDKYGKEAFEKTISDAISML